MSFFKKIKQYKRQVALNNRYVEAAENNDIIAMRMAHEFGATACNNGYIAAAAHGKLAAMHHAKQHGAISFHAAITAARKAGQKRSLDVAVEHLQQALTYAKEKSDDHFNF